MQRKLDPWTTALSAVLIVGVLLACKKKTEPAPTPAREAAATTAAAAPTPPAVTASATTVAVAEAASPKLGDVKRYPDKEKTETGAVKILENEVKVFNEADDKTADVATLDKDLFVFRLASIPDWELVEFPSGIGKVSPGWVPAKFIDKKVEAKVERGTVATQAKQAKVKATSPAGSSSAATAEKKAADAKALADKKAIDEKAAAEKKAIDEKAAADKKIADEKAAIEKAAADRRAEIVKRAADRKAKREKAAADAAAGK